MDVFCRNLNAYWLWFLFYSFLVQGNTRIMTDGFGTINYWGFSPTLDLQAAIAIADKDVCERLNAINLDEHTEVSTFLLVGCGDCRHVINTIAKRYRHKPRQLQFYIVDNNLELYARHIMFLALTLESKERMGLQEKTELFMELFANTLIRQQTVQYLEQISNLCLKFVTDLDYMQSSLPIMDLSNLKYKERDFLEGIYKFWRTADLNKAQFDVEKCWDLRLRQYLGPRYDAIPNVFDWDYSMKLCDRKAAIVNSRKYARWRQTGVAFEVREGTYDKPNKTLASGLVFKKDGERLARRGYWGDILVSPYIAFGIQCEKKSFFKLSNNMLTSTSEDVTLYNVLSMMHEIETGTAYVEPEVSKPDDKETATLTEITEEDEEEDNDIIMDTVEQPLEHNQNPLKRDYKALPVPHTKVILLPLGSASELHRKSKYQQLFDCVVYGNRFTIIHVKSASEITYTCSMVHNLSKDISSTFAAKSKIIIETSNFMLDLTDEHHKQFSAKVTAMATGVGCELAEEDSNYLYFNYCRK